MTQSMSRVAKCIDNGPMEGFWGIIKGERYYGKKFTSRESLVNMIERLGSGDTRSFPPTKNLKSFISPVSIKPGAAKPRES